MPTPNYPEDGIPQLKGQPWLGSYLASHDIFGPARILGITVGNIFFVDSGHSLAANDTANGRRPDLPFRTIDYATGQCSANNGDIVYVMPGHTETVTAAAGLDLDVAGVTYVGLGHGTNRATIRFTTATTADMDIDAANVTLINFIFSGGVDALVAPIDINAADCWILDCEWVDEASTQVVDAILTDANASRLTISGYRHRGSADAGTASAIAIVGGDRITIQKFHIIGDFSVGAIDIRTTATTNLLVRKGYAQTLNAADIIIIDTITASTGFIGPELYFLIVDNTTNITEAITGATLTGFGGGASGLIGGTGIVIANVVGEQGMPWNRTQSTDA